MFGTKNTVLNESEKIFLENYENQDYESIDYLTKSITENGSIEVFN